MEPHTLLMVGFVVLAAVVFVAARVGAVAVGVLPDATDAGDANGDTRDVESAAEVADESARDDSGGWEASRITAAERERVRKHLEKDPFHRSPDDLLPSDADDETE